MPASASHLLRSLPRIKHRALLLTPFRFLSTSTLPETSAPTPETAAEKLRIRRVSITSVTDASETDTLAAAETAQKPVVRKVAFTPAFTPAEDSKPPIVRRYEALPNFTISQAGRPTSEKADDDDGPLIRKTGANWNGAVGPTIHKEFNYLQSTVKEWNPDKIVIERKNPDSIRREREMTAPGYQPLKRQPEKRHLTVTEHRLDRPELETTWVDTHCHLFTTLRMLKDLTGMSIPENAIDSLVKALFPPQVSAVVDIHCDFPLTNLHEHATSLPWPPHFKYYFSMGVHPHCAISYTDEVHDTIVARMSHPSCVAWGECGLDYFKNQLSTHSIQRIVFARQLTAAVAAGKPIIVHTRDADDDTLALLREHVPKDHHVHVHCFTAGPKLARALMTEWTNAYIGLTGVVSYKKMEHVTTLLQNGEIPVERILLETDSPYMVPSGAYKWLADQKPHLARQRFHVSHSGMIPFTAERALEYINAGRVEMGKKEIGLVEFLDVTRGNAARMYGIDV